MYTAFVDCVLTALCGQNSAANFTADESGDGKAQVKFVHGT